MTLKAATLISFFALSLSSPVAFSADMRDLQLSKNSCSGLIKWTSRGLMTLLETASFEILPTNERVSEVKLSYGKVTFLGELSFGGGQLAQFDAEYVGKSGTKLKITSENVDVLLEEDSKTLALEGRGGGGSTWTLLLVCENPVYKVVTN